MAFTTVTLTRNTSTIVAPVGYSFTSMFFGLFPALFRGDMAAAGVLFLACVLSLIPFLGLLCLPVFFFLPGLYNRSFISRKLQEGYVVVEKDAEVLALNGLDQTSFFPLQGNERSTIIRQVVYTAVFLVICFFFGMLLAAAS